MTANGTIAPEFLSRTEVATWLNLHPGTLGNMAARGCGPKFVRTGHLQGRALYRREDVLAWLESNVSRGQANDGSQASPTSSVVVATASPAKRSPRRRAKAGVASSSTPRGSRRRASVSGGVARNA